MYIIHSVYDNQAYVAAAFDSAAEYDLTGWLAGWMDGSNEGRMGHQMKMPPQLIASKFRCGAIHDTHGGQLQSYYRATPVLQWMMDTHIVEFYIFIPLPQQRQRCILDRRPDNHLMLVHVNPRDLSVCDDGVLAGPNRSKRKRDWRPLERVPTNVPNAKRYP